ncbi:MAG TPA: SRPBCC family protein [Candidatus Angelobacter sp.]|nr:SRPBCC family protein [Candidatus Angelobacter sp.]
MPIKFERAFRTHESIDNVWEFLSDPKKVASCVPGAKITQQIDDRTYLGQINVKLGPTSVGFNGKVQVSRIDHRQHEIEITAKGQDDKGKGSATMVMMAKLRALPGGGTEVVGNSEMNVIGLLAQLGSRVVSEISIYMFNEFTKNVQEQLKQLKYTSNSEPAY